MKKFVSLVAAGSIALSLTALTASAASTTDKVISPRVCETQEGPAKIKCMRDAQVSRLQQHTTRKLGKIDDRMKKRLEVFSRQGIKIQRKSSRLLEEDRNVISKERALRLRSILKNPSSASTNAASSSSRSSAASSWSSSRSSSTSSAQ